MTNLVDEFFKRNLTEAESQALENVLETSPEEALRFTARLRQEYLATGLPDPMVSSPAPWAAPLGWGTLALAGLGALGFWLWPKSPDQPLPALPLQPPALAQKPAPLSAPPVEIKRLPGKTLEGNRLSVVVEMGKPAPVTVSILDAQGRTLRPLYQGNLSTGRWSIRWDGLLSDGSKAKPGDYRIQVRSGSYHMVKKVTLEPTP